MLQRTRRSAPGSLAVTLVAGALLLSGCTPAPTTTAVTVPGLSTSAPAESVDGRWTAFLAGDDPAASDLYMYDRATAASTFIAHGAAAPAISGDGRYVAFTSSADLLGTGPHHRDVFVWDRSTHGLSQLTHGNADSGVDGPGGGVADQPQAISADGRVLAFTTQATDLVAGGNVAGSMVSVDRSTGAVTLERPGNPGRAALDPALSADGRYLTFVQDFVQWPDGPATGTWVHRRDRETGTDVDIDLALSATISGDGHRIAYEQPIAYDVSQIVVWDDSTGTPTEIVDPTPDSGYRTNPTISADGGSVSFQHQPFVDRNDPNTWTWDVFVWDLGPNQLVRVTDGGRTGWSYTPSISGDGKTVAFASSADSVFTSPPGAAIVVGVWHRS